MKIVIARSALIDLQEIGTYYEEQGVPDIGRRFVKDILRSVERLREHPLRAEGFPNSTRSTCGRSFIRRFACSTCTMNQR